MDCGAGVVTDCGAGVPVSVGKVVDRVNPGVGAEVLFVPASTMDNSLRETIPTRRAEIFMIAIDYLMKRIGRGSIVAALGDAVAMSRR